ncbi:hypothetical protein CY35_17G100600 [Sphagnum magellanicum]|nr:hypothetical protein CY35_17G100600 [Sphagnum magellanicum]
MEVWTATLILIAVLLEALACSLSTVPGVSAQGAIFVDCGSNASYVDNITSISWVPDAPYITSGVNGHVPSAQTNYPSFSEFTTVRYFPDSRAKNCYSFPVSPNQTYLIRGTFFYGYYDNATTLPSFQMGIDGTIVANITFDDAYTFVYHEFSYPSQGNNNVTFLCLLRDSSNSVPFISAISLSQLLNDYYYNYISYGILVSLFLLETKYRLNFGGNGIVRSPDDYYDRYWFPVQGSNSTFLQSTDSRLQIVTNNYTTLAKNGHDLPPQAVIRTALTDTSGNITISFPDTNSYQGYMSLYCVELDPNATSRIYYVKIPLQRPVGVNPVLVRAVTAAVRFDYTKGWNILLYQNPITPSPLGPLVNAVELLEVRTGHMATLTNPQDALAIEEIKSSYNLKDWTGDPCVPIPHAWVTCNFGSNSGPSITEVNLAQYNLSGPISPSFNNLLNLIQLDLQNNALNGLLPLLTKLTSLRTLQLQYNFLSGELPQWLVQLPHLSDLFVQYNNFSGIIPPSFTPNNATWTFLYTPGNPLLGSPISHPKSINIGTIIGPIIGGSLALVIIICVIVYFQRQKKHGKPTKTNGHLQMMKSSHPVDHVGAKPYSLAEVVVATNNFKTMIGKGKFGPVYYGKLEDGQDVAIKELDVKSTQGQFEFFNEVDVLSRMSHRNLVSLIGYCQEDNRQMLIYEYMHKGSLHDHLYGIINSYSTFDFEHLIDP